MKIKLNKETITVFTNERLNEVYGGQNTNYERCGAPSEAETRDNSCYSMGCGSGSTDQCPGSYYNGCGEGSGSCGDGSCDCGQVSALTNCGGGATGGGESCVYC